MCSKIILPAQKMHLQLVKSRVFRNSFRSLRTSATKCSGPLLTLSTNNWAGNITWSSAPRLPSSVEELQDITRTSSAVRVLGSGHSFVPAADVAPSHRGVCTSIVSLRHLPRRFDLDTAKRTVTIDGGMTYSELITRLRGTGFTLQNTHSLPHTTVSGTICTGTHGSSGVCSETRRAMLGSQSAQVSAIDFLQPDGDIISFEQGVHEDFEGCVINLGCLGPMSALTLTVVPEFDVLQSVYGTMDIGHHWPITALLDTFDSLLTSSDSFSIMIDWPRDGGGMIVHRRFGPPGIDMTPQEDWNGVPLVREPLPPLIAGHRDFRSTHQGSSTDVLFWFVEDGETFGPQAPELQLEYFVPLECWREAMEAVRPIAAQWGDVIAGNAATPASLLLYSEIRAVRADDLWLSQTTVDGKDTLALAFGMNKAAGQPRVMEAAAQMEAALAPFSPKPHWVKLSSFTPRHVTSLYGESWYKFRHLCESHDPHRKFLNPWAQQFFDE
eukprot:m.851642 g.851642  ORF g.851642 m.851642 type:complete len:496 (-) comp23492_c0_seq10:2449-3936(-)